MNNDLISREALKDATRQLYNEILDRTVKIGIEKVYDLIDNAPTVSFMISPDYVTELQNHNKELIKQLEEAERPQGEWIRTGSLGNGNAQYRCSNCHHGDEQAESQEVPYCWHCGAKMTKGGEVE